MKSVLQAELVSLDGVKKSGLPPILFGEHHESHATSAFYPSPFKAGQFRSVDLASAREAVAAARAANMSHVVYMSVAQPAPIMKAYAGRRRMIRLSNLEDVFLQLVTDNESERPAVAGG